MTYKDVIDHFGSPTNVQRALLAHGSRITTASIAGWRKRGFVPELRQYQLQLLTGGKLRAIPLQKPRGAE
jgi:hypothetical protein